MDHSVLFHLLAVDALQGKLLLIAGQAVVVGILLHEALGANGLLTTVAGETILMPTVALVLHLFRAWWVEEAKTERVLTLTHFIFSIQPALQTVIHLQLTKAIMAITTKNNMKVKSRYSTGI